ncbi:MAG: hypothetical protein V1857_06110, partial [archaeon]
EYFAEAARLLLTLGEAENEEYANNASGVFAGMFSPAWGELAPTEVSPEERFPILIEALSSESLERRRVALRAFEQSLQCQHFIKVGHPEYQGSKRLPILWTPRGRPEIIQHYVRTWTYLADQLDNLDGLRFEALEILLKSARPLADVDTALSKMVTTTLEDLSSRAWVDRKQILQTVSMVVHYESKRLPEISLSEWTALKEKLIGTGFSNILQRYVMMDLLEDYFPNGAKYETTHIEDEIRNLAVQVVDNPELLESEYSWLVTAQAKRGHQFGYEIGRLDSKFTFLDRFCSELKKTASDDCGQLLGGYLRCMFERDQGKWEDTLERLSNDDYFTKHVPGLTWRSGMTDKALRRLILLTKKGEVNISSLTSLAFGRVLNNLSQTAFWEFVKFLLEEPTGVGTVIALDVCYFNCVLDSAKRDLDERLTLKTLLHEVFWNNPQNIGLDHMSDFRWKETALSLMKVSPQTAIPLGKTIVQFFGDERSIAGDFASDVEEVLAEAAKIYPHELWDLITEHLGPPIDRRAFFLSQWLRDKLSHFRAEEGGIAYFDPEDIWKWADACPEDRGPLLASLVSPIFFRSSDRVCLAREVLVKYGDRDIVIDALSANYHTESYTGSSSAHFNNKKQVLLKFREGEENANVLKWVDGELRFLDSRIERSMIEEEKRGF